jgi:chaperonin GroES
LIIPLLHTILVKPQNVETKTEGGIILPDMLTDKERKAVEVGTVISVGPRAFIDYGRSPDILNKGDTITYTRYAGKEIKDGDDTYLLVNDIDCLAVIQDDSL